MPIRVLSKASHRYCVQISVPMGGTFLALIGGLLLGCSSSDSLGARQGSGGQGTGGNGFSTGGIAKSGGTTVSGGNLAGGGVTGIATGRETGGATGTGIGGNPDAAIAAAGNGGSTGTGGLSATGGNMRGGDANYTGDAAAGGSAGGRTTADAAPGGTATGGAPAAGGVKNSGGSTPSGGTTATGVLAGTPPMGWNSWNKFAGGITDSIVRGIADAMVSSGMQAAGYQYINIDDCWSSKNRDGSGNLAADSSKFPSGMKAVADYLHGKGLKLGIYGDRGTQTCSGYPGSYGYETKDAQSFASWGVDYLKYDNCGVGSRSSTADMKTDYTTMGNALKATGRPIVYSICAWYFYDWMPSVGHLWRIAGDIGDFWSHTQQESDADKKGLGFVQQLNRNGGWSSRYSDASYASPGLAQHAGPGHWNDPDMLEVGNGGMTETEYQAHFSMWAIMASPLIAGNDLRSMSTATKNILTNADVIAVDQDALGIQGKPISTSTTLEVWSKKLSGTQTYAVALLNRTSASASLSVTWSSLGMTSASATVRDLWSHTDLGSIATQYSATVPSHGVVMLKVVGG